MSEADSFVFENLLDRIARETTLRGLLIMPREARLLSQAAKMLRAARRVVITSETTSYDLADQCERAAKEADSLLLELAGLRIRRLADELAAKGGRS